MYDVCIVGAGPAGSTLARMLEGRYRVLLVDRRPLDRPWIEGDPLKTCGGLLAPRAQAELARQGLGVPGPVLSGPQLFAVRTLDMGSQQERLYQRFYTNVDREAFDRWLLSLVGPGVDIAAGWRCVGCEDGPDGASVRFETSAGGKASIRARMVVGADGAASLVRRVAVPAWRQPPRYTAIQARFRLADDEPYYGAVFDESLTDFYGWTIPKGDSLVVGAAFPHGHGATARFGEFVAGLRRAGFRMGPEEGRSSAAINRPSAPAHVSLGHQRLTLVGEAAGLISPSSAEGISFALRSAAALAGALEDGLDGASGRYRTAAFPLTAEVCIKLAKSSVIYGPALRRLALASGIGAVRDRAHVPEHVMAGL